MCGPVVLSLSPHSLVSWLRSTTVGDTAGSCVVSSPAVRNNTESDSVLPANIRKVFLQILGKYCKVCSDENNDIQMEISSCNSISPHYLGVMAGEGRQ